MAERQRGYWLISLTFILGLYLQAMPMPDGLLWWRPEWVSLLLLYWCLEIPYRVGVFHGFVLGLLLDLIEGSFLGHNALMLSFLAYLALLVHSRMRMYTLLKQSLMVFVLIGTSQLVFQWTQSPLGATASTILLVLPATTSAILWPFMHLTFDAIRRRYVQ